MEYLDRRFGALLNVVETGFERLEKASKQNAAAAAAKVAREASTHAGEVKHELITELAAVKLRTEKRAEGVQKQLTEINQSITSLASAKLLQQAMFGVLLGCLFTVIFKVLGG